VKIAIPNRQGRISPVFDTANKLLLVTVSDGKIAHRTEVSLLEKDPIQRANYISKLDTDMRRNF
jgi:predicted Fe-Mo cluster-binding NifX family protein